MKKEQITNSAERITICVDGGVQIYQLVDEWNPPVEDDQEPSGTDEVIEKIHELESICRTYVESLVDLDDDKVWIYAVAPKSFAEHLSELAIAAKEACCEEDREELAKEISMKADIYCDSLLNIRLSEASVIYMQQIFPDLLFYGHFLNLKTNATYGDPECGRSLGGGVGGLGGCADLVRCEHQ